MSFITWSPHELSKAGEKPCPFFRIDHFVHDGFTFKARAPTWLIRFPSSSKVLRATHRCPQSPPFRTQWPLNCMIRTHSQAPTFQVRPRWRLELMDFSFPLLFEAGCSPLHEMAFVSFMPVGGGGRGGSVVSGVSVALCQSRFSQCVLIHPKGSEPHSAQENQRSRLSSRITQESKTPLFSSGFQGFPRQSKFLGHAASVKLLGLFCSLQPGV